jgi:hypothetical protein
MRIKRRLMVVLALSAVGAMAAVGVALAAGASSTVSFSIAPKTLLGTTGKPVKLTVHTHTTYPDVGVTKTTRAQLYFDKNILFSPTSVPKCNTATISGNITMQQAMAACGGSLVGTGTAAANSTTPGDVHGCVLVFNALDANPSVANNQPGVFLLTRLKFAPYGTFTCASAATNSGGDVTVDLNGPLATNPASTTPGGPLPAAYFQGGKWLDFNNIPQGLPLSDFNVQTGKGAPQTNLTGTKANFIKAKCTLRNGTKNWKMRTVFTYNQGTPLKQAVNSTFPATGGCT